MKDQDKINLKEQNKHDDKARFEIIVNGQKKIAPKREMDYEDIVTLAFDNPVFTNPYIIYTITYKQPKTDNQGSLVKGDKVKIEKGMVFNVTKTDKS